MISYCYVSKDEQTRITVTCKGSDYRPISVSCGGIECDRDFQTEAGIKSNLIHGPGGWPMESASCGVAPVQALEAEKYDKSLGVPTEYNKKTGDVIWRDRRHRARWIKAHQGRDNDAGYSDPT